MNEENLFDDDVPPCFAVTTKGKENKVQNIPPKTPVGDDKKTNKAAEKLQEKVTLTVEQKSKFNRLVIKAKKLEQDEDTIEAALVLYKRALEIHSSDLKLPRKIKSLEEKIKQLKEEEEEEEEDSSSDSETNKSGNCQSFSESSSSSSESSNSSSSSSSSESESESEEATKITNATPSIPIPEIIEEAEKVNENELVEIGAIMKLPKSLYQHLFEYQVQGIKWLIQLHSTEPNGGILGDDMGLGKTLQVAAFLAGMISGNQIKTALIVCPLSIIDQWQSELRKWTPDTQVQLFHGASKNEREQAVSRIITSGGVCVTTYGMVQHSIEQLCPEEFVWDYVILDEGHTIKNYTTQISQKVRQLHSMRRLLLTGTPITNKLQELWSLLDWTCEGKLLGDRKTFKEQFEDRIVKGTDRHASEIEKQTGSQIADRLKKIITPHFLRREKKDVLIVQSSSLTPRKSPTTMVPSTCPQKSPTRRLSGRPHISPSAAEAATTNKSIAKCPESCAVIRARKNDLIVWIVMSKIQQALYKSFLSSTEVNEVLNKTKSPLAALCILKKICCHPHLLINQTDTSSSLDIGELLLGKDGEKKVLEHSAKLLFLIKLLKNLRKEGHRTLIFSQSTAMLNIIETPLKENGFRWCRIDGAIKDRKSVIDSFNKDKSINCFLLTTQVGGVGLNLTSADRVVIYDPAWSILDNQAVDRVYRIGQQRNVVIYRLITCGTIEEKIYRKQVFKQSLMKATMEGDTPFRYFTKQELREMFIIGDANTSMTQQQLQAIHGTQRKSYSELDQHIEFVCKCKGVFGVSDHDLLFSKKNNDIGEITEEVQEVVEIAASKVTSTANNEVIESKDKSDTEESDEIEVPDVPPTPLRAVTTATTVSNNTVMESTNVSDTCCRMHFESLKPLTVLKCCCFVTNEERERYNQLQEQAIDFKREGDITRSLDAVLEMLQICDDDPLIQHEAFELGKSLGFC